MSKKTDIQWLGENQHVQSVLAAVCDLNGVLRGKRIPLEDATKALAGGIRMPLSIVDVDIWGEDCVGSELVFLSGDGDGICEPTGRGILPVNWGQQPTALVPLWLSADDGTPFQSDPRRALASIVQRYAALGLTPVVASELEFYLVDPQKNPLQPPVSPVTGKRLDSDGVLSLDELEQFEGFLNDVYGACELQGIPAEAAIAENGAGQFEINLKHVADPLRAADDAVFFKRLVRGVARKNGFAATFMAKPYIQRSGNGFHVHFSLLDKAGNNVFDDGSAMGSEILRHAVGGLLASMDELTLTFAPHENSYKRFLPGAHAPASLGWGYENRTTAIRIPGGANTARRIEHRVAGADANPYLVLASILGGALMGIEQKLAAPDPVIGDAYGANLAPLPCDWQSAITAFEKGGNVTKIYSRQLQTLFANTKKQELKKFNQHVSDLEYRTYLEVV